MEEPKLKLLRESWETATQLGDAVPLRFYSILLQDPVVRRMFPPGMANQRDKLMAAIGLAVTNIERLDEIRPILRQLGADHRRFGATPYYYGIVLDALLAAFAHFFGQDWTDELTDAWVIAYEEIAQTMLSAAHEQAQAGIPPWWDATIMDVDRRNAHEICLTLNTHNQPATYNLQVDMDLQVMARPGLWTSATVIETDDLVIDRFWSGLDFPSMALARLHVDDPVRIGAPWVDLESEETK